MEAGTGFPLAPRYFLPSAAAARRAFFSLVSCNSLPLILSLSFDRHTYTHAEAGGVFLAVDRFSVLPPTGLVALLD